MTGRLYSLAKFCIRHRRIVMPVWLLVIVAITWLSSSLGSQFADDISLPGRDSQAATDLVDQKFPDQANGTNPIVFKAKDGKITDSANQQAVDKVIKDVTAMDGVASANSPFTPQTAGQISKSQEIAYSNLTLDDGPGDLSNEDADDYVNTIHDAAGTFGGPVETPALDALAHDGLRYNRFHTTAICSPTRAALLTGRNSHAAGVGSVMNTATSYPGYRGVLREDTATIARILGQNGYATSAWGKWHLVPDWEASQTGPFTRWPTGAGFDKFYGFLGGETDQYEPTLYDGTTPVVRERAPGYHLTEDMAEQAVAWMQMQRAVDPARPFFVYFAPGAAHAPLQPPAAWLERYRGKFDQGWDRLREETFARQQAAGVIPRDAVLTPRPDALPAWDSLTPEEQRVSARLMELYAAFLAHTDAQVGRLRDALKDMDQYDNTLFVYIVGDNGASAEGGLKGSSNYMGDLQGLVSEVARFGDAPQTLSGENTYAHYNAGWAWGTNTPFQWTKQVASHLGGTRNPMVLAWPERIRDRGGLRSQFGHVNDIVPTILEVTGIAAPASVDGVAQRPMDGVSLAYSFDDAKAAERHATQYFEIFGNRSIYHEGWMASAFRGRAPWQVNSAARDEDFDADRWELYDLRA